MALLFAGIKVFLFFLGRLMGVSVASINTISYSTSFFNSALRQGNENRTSKSEYLQPSVYYDNKRFHLDDSCVKYGNRFCICVDIPAP